MSDGKAWNAAGGIFGFVQTAANFKYTLNIFGCQNTGKIADESGTNSVWFGAIIGGGDEYADANKGPGIIINLDAENTENTNTSTSTSSYFNNRLSGDFTFTSKDASEKLSFRDWLKAA